MQVLHTSKGNREVTGRFWHLEWGVAGSGRGRGSGSEAVVGRGRPPPCVKHRKPPRPAPQTEHKHPPGRSQTATGAVRCGPITGRRPAESSLVEKRENTR